MTPSGACVAPEPIISGPNTRLTAKDAQLFKPSRPLAGPNSLAELPSLVEGSSEGVLSGRKGKSDNFNALG